MAVYPSSMGPSHRGADAFVKEQTPRLVILGEIPQGDSPQNSLGNEPVSRVTWTLTGKGKAFLEAS